jgi:tetratricopeptide (TPR) repeat protein
VGAYDQKKWKKAIEVLSQVRVIDPTYEKDRIAQMIYQAALTYGLQLLKEERLEEAIAYLDQAAYLKPLPAEAEIEAQYARMYVTARDYWNVNWERPSKVLVNSTKSGQGIVIPSHATWRPIFNMATSAHAPAIPARPRFNMMKL